MRLPPELIRISGRQHGLITLDQWRRTTQSRASFYRALSVGLLVDVLPGVAALSGTVVGPMSRITAGVLHYGPEVDVSHRSSAFVWGAEVVGDRPVDLLLVGHRRSTARTGYRLHRSTEPVPTRMRHGLRVTSAPVTLLQLGAVVDRRVVLQAFEAMLVRRVVTYRSVERVLAERRRSGRDGVLALEWALGEAGLGVRMPDSAVEAEAARVFRRAGLQHWVFHAHIEGFEVDFAFVAERLVVEIDGRDFHARRRSRWEDGLQRDLVLMACGWQVVHLTWAMIVRHPGRAARQLAAVLAQRSVRDASQM